MKLALALVLLLVGWTCVEANTMYSYEGGAFAFASGPTWTTADRITGSFVVAGDGIYFSPPIATYQLYDILPQILSYSFSDGQHVLTEANSTVINFLVGQPDPYHDRPILGQWGIALHGNEGWLMTDQGNDREDYVVVGPTFLDPSPGADFAINRSGWGPVEWEGARGVWTAQTVSTPEPATLVLAGIGLAGVALVSWARP